ncbi:MAG: hypothetical protein AB7O80_09600 [Acetobacteraceae bacterium]
MASGSKAEQVEETLADEVTRLREQVESLVRGRVGPTVSHLAEQAEHAIGGATEAMRGQRDALETKVREQPLLSMAIAMGIGWVIGRMTR